MNVTHNQRGLFFHVPKTGGSSIAAAGFLDYIGHFPAASHVGRSIPPDRWARYFKFAFVRNPWDRFLSLYSYFANMAPGHRWHQGPNIDVAEKVKRYGSFGRFCRGFCTSGLDLDFHFWPQLFWIGDAQGNVLVDFVGRFEHLQADFDAVCARLGVGRTVLPRCNTSRHGHHAPYYDPTTARIVGALYRADVEQFGYRFPEGAG